MLQQDAKSRYNSTDEEAVVLACTSFIVCALCVHVKKSEKKTTRSVGKRLSQKRKTFRCFNSLLMSDLVNQSINQLFYSAPES